MGGLRERPSVLSGPSQRVRTGWGPVYVRVNLDDDGEPFEVFVTIGQSGGLYNAQAEALGKTISNALRSGADAETLAEDLAGIRSSKMQADNGDMIRSIPDAVGVAMLRVVRGRLGEPIRGDADPENGTEPIDSGPEEPL